MAIVGIASAAGCLAFPGAAAATCHDELRRAAPRQDLAVSVVGLVNAHRASLGLRQLSVSPALMRSALWKSHHMAAQGYFDHDDPAPPVNRSFDQRTRDCGYASGFVGENIAYGSESPGGVMTQWLNSPGHRRNIEHPDYTQIGVGAAGEARHWTQNFGGGTEPEPANPPPTAAPDTLEIAEDASGAVAVTPNDGDLGDWLHLIGVDAHPSVSTTTTPDGQGAMVTPDRDFAGTVTVGQTIADVMGQTSRTGLTVRVLPVNDAPSASADRARLRRSSRRVRIPVLRNDRDVEGDALEISITRRPKRGKASVAGTRIVYRARRRWPGSDRLTYRVTDPSGATDTATVRIRGARRR